MTPPDPDIRKLILEMATRAEAQAELLQQVSREEVTEAEWLEILARLGQDQADSHVLANTVAHRIGLPDSARQRMLAYFRRHVGEVVNMDQLRGIAGIHEWARRIRELRDQGWEIEGDQENNSLKPGQYVLRSLRSRR